MIKAKKKFGQNFLKDESILHKIIQAMPKDKRKICEIGPGLGDLTKKLLLHCESVTAFEIDLELCGYLQETFSDEIKNKQLELVCDDVLEQWSAHALVDQEYHLVANLPYYIATNLILKALDDNKCQTIMVMIQKEVAEKFAAKTGQKNFSGLSILAESISKAELLFDVGPECFDPPPKVTSAVLKLTKFKNYCDEHGENKLFEDQEALAKFKSFLKAAFAAPRKTLIKNLSQIVPKALLVQYFEELEIPINFRPHQLSSDKYHLLFKKLK
ncbi:MAG: 16S rRNA (adenine(1518)-N(6)/adenine(1519)-N(6))-dimethyltransferase RsmA [Epsilonproteobacteria bacterium]|nr:16S rRNA (adenine(1518)-N(6)/adenine(1519)-N(6))-dimethyltransferase RsmA [Campylobacterota bacterium]